ncbi:hypothetical protein CHS0354_015190 [Potamilus streckersoni]|uniref:Uncharacterized protein n=1 Tax=Potamilus streckersoni TaxID=2493646 RepID=A0AAE0SDH1_9BIVA|nr:hypothetical protein CHS0354_015190 [Potamilus streckersoni]
MGNMEPNNGEFMDKNPNTLTFDIVIDKKERNDIAVLPNTNDNEDQGTRSAPKINALFQDKKLIHLEEISIKKEFDKEQSEKLERERTGQRIFLNLEHEIAFSKDGDERDDLPNQPLLTRHDEPNTSTGERAEICP